MTADGLPLLNQVKPRGFGVPSHAQGEIARVAREDEPSTDGRASRQRAAFEKQRSAIAGSREIVKPDAGPRRQTLPVPRQEDPPEVLLGTPAGITRCRRGQQIYCQGDPAEHGYRIVSGAARRFVIQADGRRRILDFLLPGDFFGFASTDEHVFAVEAVNVGTIVARYGLRQLETLAGSDPRIGQGIRDASTQEISRLKTRFLLLGQITASAKVSAFLLEMAYRSSSDVADRIVLPMSRYDIADYLAISVETVSRAMTRLKRQGAITLAGTRRVHIVDRGVLAELDASREGGQRN